MIMMERRALVLIMGGRIDFPAQGTTYNSYSNVSSKMFLSFLMLIAVKHLASENDNVYSILI
jgi:hypothetical protein